MKNKTAVQDRKVMREDVTIHYLDYRIKKEESGQKIRSLLYERMKLSTRKIRALKKNSRGLLLNGEPVTVRRTVREGDLLQAMLDDSQEGFGQKHILPIPMKFPILYEDEDVLIVNKPKGMVVHPAAGHYQGTLVNAVMAHCGDSLPVLTE